MARKLRDTQHRVLDYIRQRGVAGCRPFLIPATVCPNPHGVVRRLHARGLLDRRYFLADTVFPIYVLAGEDGPDRSVPEIVVAIGELHRNGQTPIARQGYYDVDGEKISRAGLIERARAL